MIIYEETRLVDQPHLLFLMIGYLFLIKLGLMCKDQWKIVSNIIKLYSNFKVFIFVWCDHAGLVYGHFFTNRKKPHKLNMYKWDKKLDTIV